MNLLATVVVVALTFFFSPLIFGVNSCVFVCETIEFQKMTGNIDKKQKPHQNEQIASSCKISTFRRVAPQVKLHDDRDRDRTLQTSF